MRAQFSHHRRFDATAPAVSEDEVRGWFLGRLPDGWFTAPPEVRIDADEILIVGTLGDPELSSSASATEKAAARGARISGFREDTREQRMRVAEEAQGRFGRRVSWGASCGEDSELFTTVGVPVMTRLRMTERSVLDTLVEAGVARSRSEALAWSVRLVGEHEATWISGLRDALTHVEKVRAEGPQAS